MRQPIYNSGIPSVLKSVNVPCRPACLFRVARFGMYCLIVLLCTFAFASASDWSSAEKQLAQKIAAVTGPGAAALTFQNRSSLGKRDTEIVQNGMESALREVGVLLVNDEQAAASIALSLSENQTAYVWIAEVRQGAAESAVVMVAVPRTVATARLPDSMPMTLGKTLVWTGKDPILDLAILEGDASATRIAVLSGEDLSIYRLQQGKWLLEQKLSISHAKPWPLDLHGRLVPSRGHTLDVYLPGTFCQMAAAATLNCQESDDPWPLGTMSSPSGGSSTTPPLAGFFTPRRNFFTGVITPSIGKFHAAPKFYSAAFLPRDKYVLWLFAATDGKLHILDGIRDQISGTDWGSDIATVRTSCGAGWQVLATKAADQSGDSVRAYELPDRDPIAVSASISLPGKVSALWTQANGDSAIAVAKNSETGSYEAYRLTLACN
ncbi:MAG: hypothetical protein ACM3WP_20240 [Acidobacteriota bacterium]